MLKASRPSFSVDFTAPGDRFVVSVFAGGCKFTGIVGGRPTNARIRTLKVWFEIRGLEGQDGVWIGKRLRALNLLAADYRFTNDLGLSAVATPPAFRPGSFTINQFEATGNLAPTWKV